MEYEQTTTITKIKYYFFHGHSQCLMHSAVLTFDQFLSYALIQ